MIAGESVEGPAGGFLGEGVGFVGGGLDDGSGRGRIADETASVKGKLESSFEGQDGRGMTSLETASPDDG